MEVTGKPVTDEADAEVGSFMDELGSELEMEEVEMEVEEDFFDDLLL